VTVAFQLNWFEFPGITIQYTLYGTAIALFLGFMVNAGYARWWEARTLWGSIVNHSRNVAREATTLLDPTVPNARRELGPDMVRAQIAYVHSLRTSLRQQDPPPEIDRYLSRDAAVRVKNASSGPTATLTHLGRLLAEARRRGMIDDFARVQVESTLSVLTDAQGGLERIKKTPLPVQYRLLPSFFARTFCIILPFAVYQDLQWWTPIGSGLVGMMFLLAVQVGKDLADPFSDDVHDVPMTAISRTIEIDLLEMIGADAPGPVNPVGQVLW
jgi:putative membrane protein